MKTEAQSMARRPVISSLGLICAAQFVLQVDFSIVNVALPTIQRELGFAPADLQWVVTVTCWGDDVYLCWGFCSLGWPR